MPAETEVAAAAEVSEAAEAVAVASAATFSVSNCFGISPASTACVVVVAVVVNYSCWFYELAKREEELSPNCICSKRQKEKGRVRQREREKGATLGSCVSFRFENVL